MSARRQRGEGGISEYATKSGPRYRIDWAQLVDPDDPDAGLMRRVRAGFTTKKEAAAALRAELVAVSEGRSTRIEDTTVGQYAHEWLDGARLAETTRAAYSKILRLQVMPHIGDKKIADLRPAHLAKLYRDLEDHGRADGKGGLGANSVLKVHVLLGTILQAAMHDHVIAKNPARSPRANPPSAREVKAERPDLQPWTIEQSDRFLTWSAANHWLHPAWVVLAYTGLRRSELLGLRWGDLDLAAGKLAVRRGVTLVKEHGKGERMVVGPPKSGRERTVDIDDETIAALRTWRAEIAELGFQHVAAGEHVFAAETGGPRHPERVSRIWRNAIKACRRDLAKTIQDEAELDQLLPYTHVHGLRHAHISQLLAGGAQIKIAQERAGHATASITSDIYTHTTPTAQKDAITRFAEQREAARRERRHPGGIRAAE
ncbi:tyrosine-type recombinase/integrase [Georgenia yuyongxinii]|uniref:Site-specific integrase n=1 Tax=Georgenia yuyongxinii TaxID=2589797 RepID=A0A552WU31_9MICO|nr:site-specific integrase [Georgenia yuyongxinii]TRW46360.1 site-specific integrase [Georgenia yuyongxinii]